MAWNDIPLIIESYVHKTYQNTGASSLKEEGHFVPVSLPRLRFMEKRDEEDVD